MNISCIYASKFVSLIVPIHAKIGFKVKLEKFTIQNGGYQINTYIKFSFQDGNKVALKGFGKLNVGSVAKKATGAKMDLSAVARKPAGLGKMDMGALGKKTPFGKKGFGGFGKKAPKDEEPNGLLEGISSLHSWIKSQTMMKPGKKMMGMKMEHAYDPVI